MRIFVRKIWTFLTSMQFGIVLLVLILVFSALGSLIPQHQEPAFYHKTFAGLASFIIFMQWDRVYSSPVFLVLTGLVGTSLVLCTYKRLVRLFTSTARKDLVRRSGSVVIHVSLLLVLAGALLTGSGYSGKTVITTEQQADRVMGERNQVLARLPFTIELVRFSMDTNSGNGGIVADYRSKVVLRNPGGEYTAEISMNQPLDYQGHNLAQSGYFTNYLPELVLGRVSTGAGPETLRVGKSVPVPGTPYRVRMINFYPDFFLHNRNPGTRSNQLNNPFVQLEAQKEGKAFGGLYYAVNLKKVIPRASSARALRMVGLLDSLVIMDCKINREYATILRVTRDPGTGLFYAGGILLFLGLTAVFHFPLTKR